MQGEDQARKYSAGEFSQYILDKKDLYEAGLRNGYYLPKPKSQAVTEEYLTNVLKGAYWCPKYSDMKLLPCPRPPQKNILLEKFERARQEHAYHYVGIDAVHRPDSRWLIDVIATLNPRDEIFRKDYLPPPRKNRLADIKTIELPSSLFDGLPPSKSKAKSRRLKIVGEAFAHQKVERLKQVQKEVAVALLESQMRADQLLNRSKPRQPSSTGTHEEQKLQVANPPGSSGSIKKPSQSQSARPSGVASSQPQNQSFIDTTMRQLP